MAMAGAAWGAWSLVGSLSAMPVAAWPAWLLMVHPLQAWQE